MTSGDPLDDIRQELEAASSLDMPGPASTDHLPALLDRISRDIQSALGDLTADREQLADEILNHYEQWNAAFEAGARIAGCKTIPQALQVLLDRLNLAIDACWGYFFGVEGFGFTPLGQIDLYKDALIANLTAYEAPARDFLQRHEAYLRCLPEANRDVQAVMLDYARWDDPDYAGRGNVLAIRLTDHIIPGRSPGVMVFVRDNERQPFTALEMNLLMTLTQLGSAVLGNIIYNQKLHETYLQTIAALARAMEAKDTYTCGHSSRVATLACALGRSVGLPEGEIKLIEWAGLMHDIGKIGIRDDVLSKTGKLTDEEFTHIKTHPVISYCVLEPLEALQEILTAVRHHHEHYDGSGYPDGLAGEAIPYRARLLRVADVWDAVTSTRAYRPAMSYERAIDIMRRESGWTMDPQLVAAFLELLENNSHFRLL
ncbi:MAG: HD-GYP domain-containing protein [Sedimentisphaerales bacterium]|nr:HD-GYP domain-containing protein [Sedimentisphaerales bacterium]